MVKKLDIFLTLEYPNRYILETLIYFSVAIVAAGKNSLGAKRRESLGLSASLH